MKTTTEFEFNGQTYHLLMNAAALFDCYDKFESADILESIMGGSRKSFDNMVWVLAKLSQQGELLRRYQGEDPRKPLSMEEAIRMMSPQDAMKARVAIIAAYKAGFGQEVSKGDEERDLGLEELRKKKERGSFVRSICNGLRRFWASLLKRRC